MRALIIGAGNAGTRLAQKLYAENYDVVVLDRNAEALAELDNELDIMTVQGDGADPAALDQAQVEKCEVVAGVTSSDSTNILAGILAKRSGTEYVVARVGNAGFLNPKDYANLNAMGIDLALNPHQQCAIDISNMLKLPGIIETVGLFDNRIMAAGVVIPANSPMIDIAIKDLSNANIIDRIRFIARIREGKLRIPFGADSFQAGDTVYLVGALADIKHFLYWSCPDTSHFDKVIIASGQDTGIELARLLENENNVFVIESDHVRAQQCSTVLSKATVMNGNMLSQEMYDEIGLTHKTAFIAAGRDDEDNMIACLMASKQGAYQTIALLKEPDYVPIVDSLQLIDRTISPHISLTNSILQFIRGKNVLAAAELRTTSGEMLEIVIDENNRWVGKRIADIKMPHDSIIATIMRDGELHPAIGSFELQTGDHLAIFSTSQSIKKLESFCRG
jgi:trk system potassium uptake protein